MLDAVVEILQAAGYKCKAKVLDTCTHSHGGLPHHRPRIYLVAVLKPFIWPTTIVCHDLRRFLLNNVTQEDKISAGSKANIKEAWAVSKKKFTDVEYTRDNSVLVCDAHAGKNFLSVMLNVSPCLTKARAGNHGHYLMILKRWMKIWEIAALQGWPKPLIDALLQNFTRAEVGSTLGDGFSVSIVMRVFPRALLAAGLISRFEKINGRRIHRLAVFQTHSTRPMWALMKGMLCGHDRPE